MLVISGEEIRTLYPMKDAIEATKRAFRLFSEGKTHVPLRTNLPVKENNGQVLFMPAFVGDEKPAVGIKIVSVFVDNPAKGLPAVPSTVLLVDAENGFVKALMNGTVLTQIRTGAARRRGDSTFWPAMIQKVGATFRRRRPGRSSRLEAHDHRQERLKR